MKLIFLISLFVLPAQAQLNDCSHQLTHFENTQMSRDFWSSSKTCFVSVHPMDAFVDLTYRDYMFTSDGLFMVFNSYGPGEGRLTSGAREFYFFPRPQKAMSFEFDQGRQEISVKYSDRLNFIFDAQTAQVKGLSQGAVSVDSSVDHKNQGGVEIKFYNGLWMDAGFAFGRSPSEDSNASSTFYDENGKSCTVSNREVFSYTPDDVAFKFNDNDLKKFLKKACPTLQTSF